MKVSLRYGDGDVTLSLAGAASINLLQERVAPVIKDVKTAFLHAITDRCVDSPPLYEVIHPGDKITVVVSDITRYWMRQDIICPLLTDYLCNTVGVSNDDITFLVALARIGRRQLRSLKS